MKRTIWTAVFIILCVFLETGTYVHWWVPDPGAGLVSLVASYGLFLGALALFTAVVWQLARISRDVRIPSLRLDVLPADAAGSYRTQKTDRLVFHPDEKGTVFRSRCALRVENAGNHPASSLLVAFQFQPRGKSKSDAVARLVVDYNREKQTFEKCIQSEVEVQDGFPVGFTLRFPETLVVYPDSTDRRILAELELVVKAEHFHDDFELRYRIHSAEGNRLLKKAGKGNGFKDQTLPLAFERGGKAGTDG